MPVAKRKCKYHGTYTETFIKTPAGVFCDSDSAIKFARAAQAKQRERQQAKAKQSQVKADKVAKKAHREAKEQIKPKSKWLAEAQAAFNKYIRVRDYAEPCISCLKPREVIEHEQDWKVGGCWDAGHFMTRGAKGQLRFVLFNVHKQCKSCNAGGGKFSAKAATVDANYRINLIKKIGIDKVNFLENNNEPESNKFNIDRLKRIKKIFNKRARFYAKLRGL
jgi:hypothetical protein